MSRCGPPKRRIRSIVRAHQRSHNGRGRENATARQQRRYTRSCVSLPLQLREARTRGIPGGERALDLTCAESRQDPAYQAQVQGADNAGTFGRRSRTDRRAIGYGFGIRGFEFRIEPHLREQGGDDERRFFCRPVGSGGCAEFIECPLSARSLGEVLRVPSLWRAKWAART